MWNSKNAHAGLPKGRQMKREVTGDNEIAEKVEYERALKAC